MGFFSALGFLVAAALFPSTGFCSVRPAAFVPFVPATGLLPGTPFSSAMASRCRCPIPRELLGLGRRRRLFWGAVLARVSLQRDSQVFQWILLQDSDESPCVCLRGSSDLWAFHDSAQVCAEHPGQGKAVVTPQGSAFRHVGHLTCGKHFQSKCRHGHVPAGSKFHNVPFAHIKQSPFRDVSKALMMPLSSLQMMPGPLCWIRQFLI